MSDYDDPNLTEASTGLAALDEETGADGSPTRSATFDAEFLAELLDAVRVGEVISTLGTGSPNRIDSIDPLGLRVSTERSEQNGTGPQLVPAWMVIAAWDYLQRYGRLAQTELLNNLNVKRSAFVCALLARLPGVEVETSPRTGLRLADAAVSDEHPSAGSSSPVLQPPSVAEQASTHEPPPLTEPSAPEWPGAATYAARLNHLFETVHQQGCGPYEPEEVAAQLQADGIPLHANSITRLRGGAGGRPDDKITGALAFFFNVDPDYLFDDSHAAPPQPHSRLEQPSEGSIHAKVDHVEHAPWPDEVAASGQASSQRSGSAEVELSFTELIRIVAGLSEAAKRCVEFPSPDEDLARGLTFLVSETAPLLLQALMGDVAVSRHLLGRIRDSWHASDPAQNGTLPDYRRFRSYLEE